MITDRLLALFPPFDLGRLVNMLVEGAILLIGVWWGATFAFKANRKQASEDRQAQLSLQYLLKLDAALQELSVATTLLQHESHGAEATGSRRMVEAAAMKVSKDFRAAISVSRQDVAGQVAAAVSVSIRTWIKSQSTTPLAEKASDLQRIGREINLAAARLRGSARELIGLEPLSEDLGVIAAGGRLPHEPQVDPQG